jgi:malonyl CoA-acyl carrier protein transacylase
MLFPGQGNLEITSLKHLYQKLPEAKQLIAIASDYVKEDFSSIIESENLQETRFQQPLVCILSAAYLSRFKKLNAVIVAGHSLGELTACYAAGVFSFEALVHIAYARGKLMQEAAELCDGGMLVTIGVECQTLKQLINDNNYTNRVFIANINSDKQIVLSGLRSDLSDFDLFFKMKTCGVTRWLKVNGAWHSRYVLPVLDNFKKVLDSYEFNSPHKKLYMSFPLTESFIIEQIKTNLVEQICTPVYWSSLIKHIANEEKPMAFIEISLNSVLKGLNKNIIPEIATYSIGDKTDERKLFQLSSEVGSNNDVFSL